MNESRGCMLLFWVDKQNVPYVYTKSFQKSQKVVKEHEDGSKIFEINVVINQKIQREFFKYVDTIKRLSP